MEEAYRLIQSRVAAVEAKKPNPLRHAITELLINHPAVRPHDECSPATAKMVRYKLANGRSLGHEIESPAQHLWIAAEGARVGTGPHVVYKAYTATADGKGRHSNVNQMPDLRDQAVYRVTVSTIEAAETLLNELLR